MENIEMDITTLDRDGAIRESADAVSGTRAGFLAKAAVAAGGLIGGGAVVGAAPARAAKPSKSDVAILNFALTLEFLEAAFYEEALRDAGLTGRELDFARTVFSHESTHVNALRNALGSKAVKKPKFDFRQTTQDRKLFLKTSISLEDTGVRAYKGQAPLLDSTPILGSALSIHSVEAKHAAWVRFLANADPAPASFEKPLTKQQVLKRVKQTGFIVGR